MSPFKAHQVPPPSWRHKLQGLNSRLFPTICTGKQQTSSCRRSAGLTGWWPRTPAPGMALVYEALVAA